jgi:hypothetical protein
MNGGTVVDEAEPIAAYFAAEERDDAGAVARCFVEAGVVRDEGGTFEGRQAIEQWHRDTKKKYHHTVEPLGSVEKDGATMVTTRVAGNFPGSPIELGYSFRLQSGKIASLEIR